MQGFAVGWGIASYMTAYNFLIKYVLIFFDGDAENILLNILMYLQIASTCIYNGYPKLKSIFGFGVANKPCFESSHHRATLQDDVIANFQFQSLESYW